MITYSYSRTRNIHSYGIDQFKQPIIKPFLKSDAAFNLNGSIFLPKMSQNQHGEQLTQDLLKSFTVARIHKNNSRPINSLDYDDTGNFLVSASEDESIGIYSCSSGKLNNTIYSKKYGCSNVKFTHKATNIIYTSTKGEDAIRYMSLHDNKYLRYFKGHTNKVVSLEISPEDDTFISASLDGSVRFWDLRSPQANVCQMLMRES